MSQRFHNHSQNTLRKRDQKFSEKQPVQLKQGKKQRKLSEDKTSLSASSKKRRWIEEFTHRQTTPNLKRRRVFVDLIELQRYDGLALCSNHVLSFKIVSTEKELNSEQESFFNPKFSHQIFHKDETVRGYKDLTIQIFLTAATLRPYVQVEYSKKAENHDDIVGTLKQHFGEDSLMTTKKDFLKALNEENSKFKPFGKKVGQFTREIPLIEDPNTQNKKPKRKTIQSKPKMDTKIFEVYKVEASNEKFSKLNRRLQALIMFYIDGASFIALDGNWWYFLVYCDNKIVAYATAYEQKKPFMGKSRTLKMNQPKNQAQVKTQNKYTYKLRISQFLVLPPYQRLGIGSTLLEQMYMHYIADKKCTEITVEDPSEDFQQMKDALDIKLIWRNGFFQSFRKHFKGKKNLKSATINKFNIDDIVLDQQEILDIQQALKLKKQNILRCFELLILSKLDPKDPLAHQKFAQEVKRKFYYQMNKNLLQPYFQLESFYGSIIPSQTHHFYEDTLPAGQIHQGKHCCDGDGKILTDDNVKQFETSMNKFHHHYHGPGIPGIIEYQRVYNKYTPTPMPASHSILQYSNSGKHPYTGTNGHTGAGWPQIFGATPKFELPENLQKKILRIINSD